MGSDNNRVIEVYNQIAKQYFSKRENLVLLPELKKLTSFVPVGGKILDAGCGNGRDVSILNNWGYDVVGIDASVEQIKFAQERLKGRDNVHLINDNLFNHEFEKEFFDAIWCCAVLPHMNNSEIKEILSKFHRILKCNGVSMLTFKEGLGEELVKEPEFNGIMRYTNFHMADSIENFSRMSGFRIIEIYKYNERKRFSPTNRDLNFFVVLLQK